MDEQNYLIRTMDLSEVQLAVDWAADEGWNPGLKDAICFQVADAQGFLIGLLNDEPIAVISAVKYDKEFGFLGFYIVKPEYRGQGYGWQIWQKALTYLEGYNIGLDGVLAQQANYQKSGFQLAYRNIRYQGKTGGKRPDVVHFVDLLTLPWEKVLAYDRQCFPAGRGQFLKSWFSQKGHTIIGYREDKELQGYGVIRPCRTGYKIGPLFADNPFIAENIFLALKSTPEAGQPLFLDVPEVSPEAIALAEKYSMEIVFETARMYTGEAPDLDLAQIYGVTSFELG